MRARAVKWQIAIELRIAICYFIPMLTQFRTSKGLTQAKLAEALKVSQPYLAQLESGVRKPGRKLALAIQSLSKGAVPASHWDETEDAA